MAVWQEIVFVAFFISLPFLYDTRRSFRYHFRLATFTVLAALTSLLAVFHYKQRASCSQFGGQGYQKCFCKTNRCACRKNNVPCSSRCHEKTTCNNKLIAYFGQQISDLLCIEWRLRGKQNLKSKRSRVAIINYQTDIDILGLLHLNYFEAELNIISDTNLINLWPFSFFPWLLSLALCPIQFFSTSLELLYLSPTIIDLGPTVVLPSTKMTNEETIKMALKKKLPIQPIVYSKCYFINKEKHLFEPGRIIISVMPIIETDGLLESDVSEFSNEISTRIRAEYDCISKITELRDYQTPYL